MHEQFYIGLTVLQMPLFLIYDKDYLQACSYLGHNHISHLSFTVNLYKMN